MLHCWQSKREWLEAQGITVDADLEDSTCLLEDEHKGEHVWTPDGDIVFTFSKG